MSYAPFAIFLARAYGWSLDWDAIGLWVTEPGVGGEPSQLIHLPTPKNWAYVNISVDQQ